MIGRLVALFILVPLVETYLFLQVGAWMGPFPALLIIVATGFLGAWLTRTQGLSVIRRFRSSLSQGRLPQQEAIEGLLILIAGILLMTPGFLTDIAGYLLLIPPLRLRVGEALRGALIRRLRGAVPAAAATAGKPGGAKPGVSRVGPVIDVEILEK
jgi:UPF0716 protein FxsA